MHGTFGHVAPCVNVARLREQLDPCRWAASQRVWCFLHIAHLQRMCIIELNVLTFSSGFKCLSSPTSSSSSKKLSMGFCKVSCPSPLTRHSLFNRSALLDGCGLLDFGCNFVHVDCVLLVPICLDCELVSSSRRAEKAAVALLASRRSHRAGLRSTRSSGLLQPNELFTAERLSYLRAVHSWACCKYDDAKGELHDGDLSKRESMCLAKWLVGANSSRAPCWCHYRQL